MIFLSRLEGIGRGRRSASDRPGPFHCRVSAEGPPSRHNKNLALLESRRNGGHIKCQNVKGFGDTCCVLLVWAPVVFWDSFHDLLSHTNQILSLLHFQRHARDVKSFGRSDFSSVLIFTGTVDEKRNRLLESLSESGVLVKDSLRTIDLRRGSSSLGV